MVTRTDATQAIWAFAEHEHQDLRRGINRIHDVACEVGQRPTPELSVDVISVLTWIHDMLEPHIAWEDGWLYPEIEARLGTPWATRAARFDHQQIRQMAENLTDDEIRLGNHQAGGGQAETRCHLFSLEALLRAHLEREERFLIPILAETASASVEPSARPGS
jgi:hemerythrin-like domain-containing protein